jgi:phospholipase/lecithinase/hemolysin
LLISVILTPAARAGSFSEIYVFGDSFSDSGNAFAATGGLIPSDPPYFQGRFSNGPVWAERLAELLGLTLVANGPDPEVVIGNNFAVAGSRAAEDVPVLFLGTIPSVATQVEFFTSALPVVPADALYVIFSSHDDLRGATDPAEALNEPQRRQRARAAVDAITTAVGRLAAAGATTFLIPNSVDLGRTPESGVFGNSATLTQLVGFYNLALNVALAESEKTLGVTIVQADMFAFGEQVVDDALNNNGGVFGLTNIDVPILEGVAGSPGAPAETSLFFDDLHPSAVAHTLLGEFAFAAVQTALGSGEGGQLPGDCNQDGQLDISDGITWR